MGYFASFLVCHLYFRHRFISTGYRIVDVAWRATIYLAIVSWAALVAYSRSVNFIVWFVCTYSLPLRYHLGYHNDYQILWGIGIGVVLGVSLYVVAQLLPQRYPRSIFGQTKDFIISNPISTFLQLRDGWDVWGDGGRGEEWAHWRAEWDARRRKEE